jgi:3-phosphoshikimate 1-carboxyvinyltransferase
MNIKITKPIQGGTVKAIPSKSEAHRLLICAVLTDGETENETFISCPERSEDINATAECLCVLGADIRIERDGFYVKPINRRKIDYGREYVLDCGESGSTLRFILPVCGAIGINAVFKMGGRLPKRPLSPLYEEMVKNGCELSEHGASPLTCRGRLQSGVYTISGDVSSQYISGLLLALPLIDGGGEIAVTGVLESRPYVDMTIDTLRLFGITVTEDNNTFRIKGNQSYVSPKTCKANGDWSNAAFWLTAGAIGNTHVTCTGLDLNSKQGDRMITELLTRFGAKVEYGHDSVTVSPNKLTGIEIDAENTPDLVPVLAVAATAATGRTIIRNAKRLRIKESDRLNTVAAFLTALGADITETDDGLIINGKNKLYGGITESFGDHRIAMAEAVAACVCENPVIIRNAEAVNKSYPKFFEDFITVLGGGTEVLYGNN